MKLEFFDLSFRTAYAQAKEITLAQDCVPLLTPGSLQTETRGGGSFVYRYRYDASGKRVAEYLGPVDNATTTQRIGHAQGEIQDASLIADYSRNLRRIGYHGTDNSTLITLAALFNAGIFGSGGILVGTHAFGAILNELGVAAGPMAMTEDVDIARANPIQIAALPSGGLLQLLAGTGLPFHPVQQLNRKEPPTSFKVRGKKLIVDLLVPARGEACQPVAVPELGAHATGLPHLKYLLEGSTRSILIGRDRMVPVVVPHAGRYCIHKLAVYALRGGSNPKSGKDLQQAATLAVVIGREQDFMLAEAIDAMSVGLRTAVKRGAGKTVALLADEHPEAASILERLA